MTLKHEGVYSLALTESLPTSDLGDRRRKEKPVYTWLPEEAGTRGGRYRGQERVPGGEELSKSSP